MSEIVFHCTKCGAKLSAEPDEVAEQFECPVCETMQTVPGEKPEADTKAEVVSAAAEAPEPPPSTRVVRIPKKKIVMSTVEKEKEKEKEEEDDDDYLEEEIEEETGGSGLRVFAVMIGTSGVVLCLVSLVWAVLAQGSAMKEWWVMILMFISTFLLALMGVVLALVAFRVERIAARLQLIISGE